MMNLHPMHLKLFLLFRTEPLFTFGDFCSRLDSMTIDVMCHFYFFVLFC